MSPPVISVQLSENGVDQGVQSLPEETAIELLQSGAADLCKQQSQPPVAILEILRKHAENPDIWGPSITSSEFKKPDLLTKVDERLFGRSSLQSFVDGNELDWAVDHWESKALFEMKISKRSGFHANLINKLFSILDWYLDSAGEVHFRNKKAAEAQLAERKIFKQRSRGPLIFYPDDADNSHSQISPEWWPFATGLYDLEDSIGRGFKNALKECRVIAASKPEGGTFSFASPKKAALEHKTWSGKTSGFLHTSELPTEWFGKALFRKQQDQRILEALKAYSEHSNRQKRFAKMDDLRSALVRLLGVSDAQARKGINKFEGKLQKLGPRPSEKEVINLRELDTFFQGVRF